MRFVSRKEKNTTFFCEKCLYRKYIFTKEKEDTILNVSDVLNCGIYGHRNFEFVDVYLLSDNRLFIDPCLIEIASDPWSQKVNLKLKKFFDQLYYAFKYKTSDRRVLLSHANEQNSTRLGYGNGLNGKGKTTEGMLISLKGLSDLVQNIPTICKPSDITVLVSDFGEDNMSDLITNIIHEELNEFTLCQMQKWGYVPTMETVFWTWNSTTCQWEQISRPSCTFNGHEILLVPKWIVRKNYLMNIHQYFYTIILEKLRDEQYPGWTKRDIYDNFPKECKSWERDYTVTRTYSDPILLGRYHDRAHNHYMRSYGMMSDDELDAFIYKGKRCSA